MLKIKDNVDMKELEKFGFKYYEHEFEWYNERYTNIAILDDKHWDKGNRGICNVWSTKDLEILFDLIQAGLVEKVKG